MPSDSTIYPQSFSSSDCVNDPLSRLATQFFHDKGLAALKDEDRREMWYDDWLSFQAKHQLYARLLSPKRFSTLGGEFDLLRYSRFLEVFAWCSPAHGYSLQVSFLALFAILMGSNEALKQEAVAALEAGGLLAFAVSEKDHGSDLLGNEFAVREIGDGRFIANGTKYYIGNSNAASIIVTLARKDDDSPSSRRAPFVFFALRPRNAKGFIHVRKIHTMGVRGGFVGEFKLIDHEFPAADLVCDGRKAWDVVFGAVTLGKFFLGFGSIGICEHAFEEAAAHLSNRPLYGKPAVAMPHLRLAMTQAYARLTAMKLYAYRTLDYVQACSAQDRRYLLFTAVQKARVCTEGVKVMSMLCECIGAKGFEADTYFEMALRDVQLLPVLEGSMHINLGLTARFIARYFFRPDAKLADPESLIAGQATPGENDYLTRARTGALNTVAFGDYLNAYQPLAALANVSTFMRQIKAFRAFIRIAGATRVALADPELALALGQCLATVAYAQLIAENAVRLAVPTPIVSGIFHLLVNDFSTFALTLASSPKLNALSKVLMRRLVRVPRTSSAEWDFVSEHAGLTTANAPAPTPA